MKNATHDYRKSLHSEKSSDMSTDKVVDITITMANSNVIDDLEAEQCDYGCNGLEKYFKDK